MYAGIKVASMGDNTAQRRERVDFCLFGQVEEIGKVNHTGGISFMKGDSAFVYESRHRWLSMVKGSPIGANAAAFLIGYRIPARILEFGNHNAAIGFTCAHIQDAVSAPVCYREETGAVFV